MCYFLDFIKTLNRSDRIARVSLLVSIIAIPLTAFLSHQCAKKEFISQKNDSRVSEIISAKRGLEEKVHLLEKALKIDDQPDSCFNLVENIYNEVVNLKKYDFEKLLLNYKKDLYDNYSAFSSYMDSISVKRIENRALTLDEICEARKKCIKAFLENDAIKLIGEINHKVIYSFILEL
jgi:hypothetical protein